MTHTLYTYTLYIYMHTLYPPAKGEGGRFALKAQDRYIYKIHFMSVSLRRLPGQPRTGKTDIKRIGKEIAGRLFGRNGLHRAYIAPLG